MVRVLRLAMVLSSVLTAAPALAQRVDGRGQPFRPWDVHVGSGVHFMDRADGSADGRRDWFGDWHPSAGLAVDVGRYWTSHFKTEAGVWVLTDRHAGGQDVLVLPDGGSAWALWDADVRQQQLVGAATYQFFDNAFAHPYVSAGARVGLVTIHAVRQPFAYRFTGPMPAMLTLPAVEETTTRIRARPFVAVGSKSYLTERTFVRPELSVAFNATGISQVGLRLGFGVDF